MAAARPGRRRVRVREVKLGQSNYKSGGLPLLMLQKQKQGWWEEDGADGVDDGV